MFDYIIDENLLDLIKSYFKLFIAFTQQKSPDYHVVTNEPPMKSRLRIFFQNNEYGWRTKEAQPTRQSPIQIQTFAFGAFIPITSTQLFSH